METRNKKEEIIQLVRDVYKKIEYHSASGARSEDNGSRLHSLIMDLRELDKAGLIIAVNDYLTREEKFITQNLAHFIVRDGWREAITEARKILAEYRDECLFEQSQSQATRENIRSLAHQVNELKAQIKGLQEAIAERNARDDERLNAKPKSSGLFGCVRK